MVFLHPLIKYEECSCNSVVIYSNKVEVCILLLKFSVCRGCHIEVVLSLCVWFGCFCCFFFKRNNRFLQSIIQESVLTIFLTLILQHCQQRHHLGTYSASSVVLCSGYIQACTCMFTNGI